MTSTNYSSSVFLQSTSVLCMQHKFQLQVVLLPLQQSPKLSQAESCLKFSSHELGSKDFQAPAYIRKKRTFVNHKMTYMTTSK